ncbi:MAG TPA: hypothetical protein VFV67_30300 [Actinophytocola sp.]|uniref:hypothetical protein n=1 Tax=Actinophytocola sp. TaxID=1872138 RepID=UPI002DBB4019|nr:hypothetical protein [Actinophytocola sp.]HEU5474956.1 hypothetical protein [Actinophytocola sp.]
MPIVAVLGAGALALVLTPALTASAAAKAPSCSNATLKGTYTFASGGWTVAGGSTTPFALAGVEHYDGAGNIAGVVTTSINGVIIPGTPNTGTYQINADCTGTAAFTNSGVTTHFDIYVSPDGDEFQFVGTDPGAVTSATEIRVSRR